MTTETEKRYKCNVCPKGRDLHTRDEVILKANKDLLSALDFIPELLEENAEALTEVQGAILHALDELQLLEVEGFKHPDEPSDDVSDEQRVWRAANEVRG